MDALLRGFEKHGGRLLLCAAVDEIVVSGPALLGPIRMIAFTVRNSPASAKQQKIVNFLIFSISSDAL